MNFRVKQASNSFLFHVQSEANEVNFHFVIYQRFIQAGKIHQNIIGKRFTLTCMICCCEDAAELWGCFVYM